MTSILVDLDKSMTGGAASFGAIEVRVVVLKTRKDLGKGGDPAGDTNEPVPAVDEEEPIDDGLVDSPLATYLERKKFGKQCVVFLVNGQRHDALDNSFIARSLGFKHLRNRTMIVVELDRLAPEALAEIVQGSRQGLFKGRVLDAVKDRIVAALKKDPDLTRLQQEAERRISELDSGDRGVRDKLDKLIDSHHTAAQHHNVGNVEPGDASAHTHVSFGDSKPAPVVVQAAPTVGDPADLPVLDSNSAPSMRLVPDLSRTLRIRSLPPEAWAQLENIDVRVEPAVPELTVAQHLPGQGLEVRLRFAEPDDFDDEALPIETTLRVHAKFRGSPDIRQLERNIVIARGSVPPPKKVIQLSPTPTFIKVSSRQPVQMVAGGPSTHVKLRWDGDDSLAAGARPAWRFTGRCTSLASFPAIHFSLPNEGRLEALVDAPHGLLPSLTLEFEVEARGPGGTALRATFQGIVVPAPVKDEPRRVTGKPPEATAFRKPPYTLKTITKEHWSDSIFPWGERPWTKDDPGVYEEPTETAPLVLIVNEDAEELARFRAAMVARNLDESTVRERLARYQTHIAFHLYKMYLSFKRRELARAGGDEEVDDRQHGPRDEDMREEIQRVASTMLGLMEVSAR